MLLWWNDLLLRQLRLPAAAKAAARVVISQVGLLDSLCGHPDWPRIARVAGRLLREKPALLDDYVAAARSGEMFAEVHLRHINMFVLFSHAVDTQSCTPQP